MIVIPKSLDRSGSEVGSLLFGDEYTLGDKFDDIFVQRQNLQPNPTHNINWCDVLFGKSQGDGCTEGTEDKDENMITFTYTHNFTKKYISYIDAD